MVKPKGEALAFGVLGGVAFIGFLLSFGIRNENLEAEDWDENEGDNTDTDDENINYEHSARN